MTSLLVFYSVYCLACVWARIVSRKQERAARFRNLLNCDPIKKAIAEGFFERVFHDALFPVLIYRSKPMTDEQRVMAWSAIGDVEPATEEEMRLFDKLDRFEP